MDNLLQPVLQNYPNLNVRKRESPSYIDIYTKNKKEIVLVHDNLKNKQITNTNNKTDNKVTEELDLTGSPLKLDLSLHTVFDDTLVSDEPQLWNKEEALHQPLSIEKAREIANLYSQSSASVPEEDAVPMWILTNPSDDGKPLLLTVQSDSQHFTRGIVSYQGTATLEDVDLINLIEQYAEQEKLKTEMINLLVDCKFLISGISYGSHNTDELLNAPHTGLTELHCEWPEKRIQTPFISCKVHLEQEVIVGHLMSPCNAIWKSVSALHNINQMLVDMTAAGYSTVDLDKAIVRNIIPGAKRVATSARLAALLADTEALAYSGGGAPAGGCAPGAEDPASLQQCLAALQHSGSSTDFTYKLWDILTDCETAEEVITLLMQALKFISSGKIRPFIDANNKTYLSKLVLKLSRGHSQAAKVLKNLKTSPPQALSLVAQVGTEKTMWEYTKIMSLLEHSYYIAGIWTAESRTHESIEQINQTIQDMSMGGDFTLNPFDTFNGGEHSIRLDCESFCAENENELTVDDFASLKKHGLVDKKDINEVPLIADEIDISPWKNLLMKFAQVHVCLEHLYRAETTLRADFANLKPIASRLLEYYVSDKSPIRTVGQLINDPVQKISMPIANNIVQDHLKKPAFWYRVELSRKEAAKDLGIKRHSKTVYVLSQQPVFPPAVWQNLEPSVDDAAEITTVGEELKYHITKFTHLTNEVVSEITL